MNIASMHTLDRNVTRPRCRHVVHRPFDAGTARRRAPVVAVFPGPPLETSSTSWILSDGIPLFGRACTLFVGFTAALNWLHYRGVRKEIEADRIDHHQPGSRGSNEDSEKM